ncbi:MAG: transcription termination/antitermination protein NusA, partial [Pseudomonadota bacterium]|nr:transcription termination/antitermination protein NusA [Pseudomonadota bacterium]
KTLEDFAGCVTDDLTGWFETVERKRVRQDGILDGFDISPEEAEVLIMSAPVKAGWVTQEELDALAAEKAAAEAASQAEELTAGEGPEGDAPVAEASAPDTDATL